MRYEAKEAELAGGRVKGVCFYYTTVSIEFIQDPPQG